MPVSSAFRCIGLSAVVLIVAAVAGCSEKSPAPTEEEQQKQKQERAAKDAEAAVYEALDDAISRLEKKDYRRFLEHYWPARSLMGLRRDEDGGVARIAEEARDDPARMEELLATLRRIRQVKPKFFADNSIAVFETKTPVSKVHAENLPLAKPVKDVKVDGYGDDLPAALQKAADDVEAGKFAEYLSRMLPVIELQLNDVQELAKRFAENPRRKVVLLDDLKTLQATQPRLSENGTVAEFELPPLPESVLDKEVKTPPRVFQFQKVDGHWRLFDNTTPLRKATGSLSRQVAAMKDVFVMEKFGDDWRLAEDDDVQFHSNPDAPEPAP